MKQVDADSNTDAEGNSVGDDVVVGAIDGFVASTFLLLFFDLAGCVLVVVVVAVVGHNFRTSAVNIGMTGTRRSTPGACASMV